MIGILGMRDTQCNGVSGNKPVRGSFKAQSNRLNHVRLDFLNRIPLRVATLQRRACGPKSVSSSLYTTTLNVFFIVMNPPKNRLTENSRIVNTIA
jgi:hypothetical protein